MRSTETLASGVICPTAGSLSPKHRKEPLTDASRVRNAIARFDQTIDVSDEDRELAFANIKKAAAHYHVDMPEKNWKELGSRPSTGRTKDVATHQRIGKRPRAKPRRPAKSMSASTATRREA